ncbi:hypothetical protein CAL26_24660 [Bordetella genomosp. 9]|uniref:OmpR/PhoB-type domain-containing protein n=1 Tax=Bordetella genomosp. 9 TaxID=1416803 RepID=A0A261R6N7_9BORD|nr:hypothetical protein [Bordetella genomosp. 9]OZI20674.1 hypothetical protein CAL26_24660 [Bordetella genomosp. 9]
MIDYLDVIVLQDARAVRDNLAEELAKRDFAVRSCGSLAGLRHLYATQPAPLLVLTGDSDDLACDAQSARLAAPSAIIIALGTSADTAWRTHVMAAGADACHSASIDIAELMAILLAWGRQAVRGFSVELPVHARALGGVLGSGFDARAEHGFSPAPALPDAPAELADDAGDHDRDDDDDGDDLDRRHDSDFGRAASDQAFDVLRRARAASQSAPSSLSIVQPPPPCIPRTARLGSGWRLDANCRVLVCPHDRTLFVTAAENSFLMRIAACEGQLLRRQRGLASPTSPTPAAPSAEGEDHGTQPMDIRSMDVLVSRLRRKARRAGIELPLLAVRGCGYLFSECLTVTPSAPAPRAAGNLKPHAAAKPVTLPPIQRPPYKLEDSGRMHRPYCRDADLQCDLSVHEVVYQLLAA